MSDSFSQNMMMIAKQHHLFLDAEREYENRRSQKRLEQQAIFQAKMFELMNSRK